MMTCYGSVTPTRMLGRYVKSFRVVKRNQLEDGTAATLSVFSGPAEV